VPVLVKLYVGGRRQPSLAAHCQQFSPPLRSSVAVPIPMRPRSVIETQQAVYDPVTGKLYVQDRRWPCPATHCQWSSPVVTAITDPLQPSEAKEYLRNPQSFMRANDGKATSTRWQNNRLQPPTGNGCVPSSAVVPIPVRPDSALQTFQPHERH
jgi:hypothetical protein